MKRDTTSQEFFDKRYRQDPDPWNFASSEYEGNRYRTTLDALKHRSYARAFEPGCSIGVLTVGLAAICDQVNAMDISPTAVSQARERCKTLPNVNVICGKLPETLPDGSFDLIVLSEIGYYFDEPQLKNIGRELIVRLREKGVLLATHWLGTSEDHLLSGSRVHEIIESLGGIIHTHAESHPGFRLDRWERA